MTLSRKMMTDYDLGWARLGGNPGRDLRLLNQGVTGANQEQKGHSTISSPPNLPWRITAFMPD